MADHSISRRDFIKWSSALGAVASFGRFNPVAKAAAGVPVPAETSENTIWSACRVNCNCHCPVQVHVKDGVITGISPDDSEKDDWIGGDYQVRACLRGRSLRRHFYSPNRLNYPMKRVGKRGEGKFERITWEQAFKEIAAKLKQVKADYGNDAIYFQYATGSISATMTQGYNPSSPLSRLMNLFGGYLGYYGTYSSAQITKALPYLLGTSYGSAAYAVKDAKLFVGFGYNPGENAVGGAGQMYNLNQAVEAGKVKTIQIEPRYTDTAATACDQWIPIRPGTDAALAEAVAYVLITEEMVDQDFLDNYCIGYDEKTLPEGAPANGHYKAHILGQGPDKTAKTPEWGANITGVPVDTIVKLAREIGTAKPCFITQGLGVQRQAYGEQNCMAIAMLAVLTGNIGKPGTNNGAAADGSAWTGFPRLPAGSNPVGTKIPVFMWPDAIKNGAALTAKKDGVVGADQLKNSIKFMFNTGGNILANQHSDLNAAHEILADESLCEMIVGVDVFGTPSSKYFDIILPAAHYLEARDASAGFYAGRMSYLIAGEKAVDPMFERKNMFEIALGLSQELGLENEFTEGLDYDGWLRRLHGQARKNIPALPDFDGFFEKGVHKFSCDPAGLVAMTGFRKDPEKNKLGTPSGKIEIYSQQLADIAADWELGKDDVITPVPQYVQSWESAKDPLAKDYPLQLIGFHTKARVHSSYANVDWLNEAVPDEVWINPLDAEKRGIKAGSQVEVFNGRGRILIHAKVTPRIMPGVIAIGQGAWRNLNAKGVDQGGCINTLTRYKPTPLAKANPQHTNLAQVKAL